MTSAGAEPVQVTHNGGTNPVLTADGTWIYYVKDNGAGGLWRLSAAGGAETRVIEMLYRWNFALTRDGIYYTSRDPDAPTAGPAPNSTIRFLDGRTGTVRDLLVIDKPVDLGFSVSPDGKYLLFTKLDYAGNDLMLVENFR